MVRCLVRRCGDIRTGGRGVRYSRQLFSRSLRQDDVLPPSGRKHLRSGAVVPSPGTAQQLKAVLRDTLGAFPWRIRVSDWTGQQYSLGLGAPHWRGLPLEVHLRSEAAGHDLLSLNALAFLGPLCAGRGGPPREPVPAVGYPAPRQAFRAVLATRPSTAEESGPLVPERLARPRERQIPLRHPAGSAERLSRYGVQVVFLRPVRAPGPAGRRRADPGGPRVWRHL